jgi:hypothetical protein
VDEKTSTIKQHIDDEREQLGRNLDEIEYRVKKATNLKNQFDRNTAWILGAAVVGGFALSRLLRTSSASEGGPRWQPNATEHNTNVITPRSPTHLSRVSETLDDIFDGLVGVVSDKLHSFVADAVPGFRKQYDAIEGQRGRSSVHHMNGKLGTETEIAG